MIRDRDTGEVTHRLTVFVYAGSTLPGIVHLADWSDLRRFLAGPEFADLAAKVRTLTIQVEP